MSSGMPERKEDVVVHAQFDATKLNKEDIYALERLFNIKVAEDGEVTVDYPFDIEYFNIAGKFTSFLDMLDKAAIVDVNTEELCQGKCLLQELLCRLEQIEQKYVCKETGG